MFMHDLCIVSWGEKTNHFQANQAVFSSPNDHPLPPEKQNISWKPHHHIPSLCLIMMDLWIDQAVIDVSAVMPWSLAEALLSALLLNWGTFWVGRGGKFNMRKLRREQWISRKQFTVIVVILTSLKTPEERVLSRGAPRDLRKLDHKVLFCVWVSVVSLSILRDCCILLCKSVWPCAVRVDMIGYHAVQLWYMMLCEGCDCWSWTVSQQ